MLLKINEIKANKLNCESVKDSSNTQLFNSQGAFLPARLNDLDAPNNSIYYSNTQSELVYKDSNGTIWKFSLEPT